MDGMHYYGRDGQEMTIEEWAAMLEQPEGRRVAKTEVTTPTGARMLVSTVLIGLNMRFGGDGPPIIFETMVFALGDGPATEQWHDLEVRRYCTEREALEGHAEVVGWLNDFGYEPVTMNSGARSKLERAANAMLLREAHRAAEPAPATPSGQEHERG